MDVEGPDSPIRSVRDFAVHIATVTLGILIALGLEGLVEAHRDRELVQHSETDFRIEFTANRAEVIDDLKRSPAVAAELLGLIAYGQAKLAGKTATLPTMATARKFTEVEATAWETATATQALLHIPSREAGMLSHAQHAQHAQQAFNALQDRAEAQWFELAAYGDPRTVPAAQIPGALQKLTIAYAYLASIQNTEETLVGSYDKALAALPRKDAAS